MNQNVLVIFVIALYLALEIPCAGLISPFGLECSKDALRLIVLCAQRIACILNYRQRVVSDRAHLACYNSKVNRKVRFVRLEMERFWVHIEINRTEVAIKDC